MLLSIFIIAVIANKYPVVKAPNLSIATSNPGFSRINHPANNNAAPVNAVITANVIAGLIEFSNCFPAYANIPTVPITNKPRVNANNPTDSFIPLIIITAPPINKVAADIATTIPNSLAICIGLEPNFDAAT